jgi:hypothetical protein
VAQPRSFAFFLFLGYPLVIVLDFDFFGMAPLLIQALPKWKLC